MRNDTAPRVARLGQRELTDMPSAWTDQERGYYLRLLLQFRGIDTRRLYRVEYYPHRRCWLLLQRDEPSRQADASESAPSGQADERFYCQTVAELRRTALAVCTTLAAESLYFARFGRSYQVPAQPRDLTPATLTELLGGYHEAGAAVHFDSEGRWWVEPSAN